MNDLKAKIVETLRHRKPNDRICVPKDFLDIGTRAAIDQALSRLVREGVLRRVARGIYDMPNYNTYLKRLMPVDPVKAVQAIARRDNIRIAGTGMAAANMLGLTNAVSVRPDWETTGPTKTLKIKNWTIRLRRMRKKTAEWIDRPALPVVQALYWLGADCRENEDIVPILRKNLTPEIKTDLTNGIQLLPLWMSKIAKQVLSEQQAKFQRKEKPIAERIMQLAHKSKEGEILTPKGLFHLGERNAIDQALHRLVQTKKLMKVYRGIYVKPISTRFGIRGPDIAKMLENVAKMTGEPIVRHGAVLANMFGLTTQVPMREIWMNSGPAKNFKIGKRIVFVEHAPRWQMLFPNQPAGDAIRAVAWMGEQQVIENIKKVKSRLRHRDWEMFVDARVKLPTWIRNCLSAL